MGDTGDDSPTGEHGQPGNGAATSSSSSNHPIFNPAAQGSSSRLSQDNITQIVAAVGVHSLLCCRPSKLTRSPLAREPQQQQRRLHLRQSPIQIQVRT